MDFVYYVVRKKDTVIVDIADDMVNAVKKAQQMDGAYLIMQGCIITEIGQDIEESFDNDNNDMEESFDEDIIMPDVIEDDEE
jgi:hypothetical protein